MGVETARVSIYPGIEFTKHNLTYIDNIEPACINKLIRQFDRARAIIIFVYYNYLFSLIVVRCQKPFSELNFSRIGNGCIIIIINSSSEASHFAGFWYCKFTSQRIIS